MQLSFSYVFSYEYPLTNIPVSSPNKIKYIGSTNWTAVGSILCSFMGSLSGGEEMSALSLQEVLAHNSYLLTSVSQMQELTLGCA